MADTPAEGTSGRSHHVELTADGALIDGHPIHCDEIRIRPRDGKVELVLLDATLAATLPPHYRHHISETSAA